MNKIKIFLAFYILITLSSNAQTNLGVIYGNVDDSTTLPNYAPCFISKNRKWQEDTTTPKQNMYSIYPNFRFAIAASSFKETYDNEGEKLISANSLQANGYLKYQQLKFGESNNDKPLPVCNKKNIKIHELLFEGNAGLLTKKLIASLKKLNKQNGNPIIITDSCIKKLFTIRKINFNQYIIIATTNLDICKIDTAFINNDTREISMMSQLSRDKMLKKTMFLLTGTALKIITHEVDEIAFADFDGDGKKEMFLSQFRESYNNCYLYCDNFSTLICKSISGN